MNNIHGHQIKEVVINSTLNYNNVDLSFTIINSPFTNIDDLQVMT
jgi:hypothetical protein